MKIFDWLKRPFVPSSEYEPDCMVPLGAVVVQAPKYPEAERIATSLRDFPEDWAWQMKGYRLQHVPSGFQMWVANGQNHLAECTEGKDIAFNPEEQAIIWASVQPWIDSFKVGFSGRLPKVKIRASGGTYWCVANGHPWAGAGNSPADAYNAWARAVSIQARRDINPTEYLHVWSGAL